MRVRNITKRDLDGVSMKTLSTATTKPDGVSDARWRMELSRRKMERLRVVMPAVEPVKGVWR